MKKRMTKQNVDDNGIADVKKIIKQLLPTK